MDDRTPLPDSYALHPDGQALAAALIARYAECEHLAQARLAVIGSQPTPMLRGWPCAAFVCEPRVQGPLRTWLEWALADFCRPVCEGFVPDFLVLLDAALWPSLDGERQERLIYHELLHIVVREDENGVPRLGDDGRVLLRLRPHDYEVFDAELRRYGPEVCDVTPLATALADGYRDAQRRARRTA